MSQTENGNPLGHTGRADDAVIKDFQTAITVQRRTLDAQVKRITELEASLAAAEAKLARYEPLVDLADKLTAKFIHKCEVGKARSTETLRDCRNFQSALTDAPVASHARDASAVVSHEAGVGETQKEGAQ
jgi:hypothetical protein